MLGHAARGCAAGAGPSEAGRRAVPRENWAVGEGVKACGPKFKKGEGKNDSFLFFFFYFPKPFLNSNFNSF